MSGCGCSARADAIAGGLRTAADTMATRKELGLAWLLAVVGGLLLLGAAGGYGLASRIGGK
jgi:hypothetical protein